MPASSAGPDDQIERHVSPDGRMRVEVIRAFHPNDIHEIAEQRRVHVRDAATGATLLDLRNVYLDSRFEWTADGGVEIMMDGSRVTLAADGRSWSTSADGGAPHPIGEAARRLPYLLDPPRRPTARDWWERFKSGVLLIIVLVGVAGFGWKAWRGELRPRWNVGPSPEHRPQPANAWAPVCPAPWGIMPMHLDTAGRLVVPAALAPAPLAPLPVEAGGYGDGRVVVELRGTGATIWPEGENGPAMHCTGEGDMILRGR